MEFEVKGWWLFADDLPQEGSMFEFVNLEKTPKGQVMMLLGKVKERVGDFQVFPGKISNLKDIIKKIGKDDAAWSGKRFVLKPTEDKKNFMMTLV